MHILLIGLFRPGAGAEVARLQLEWNEHLAQRSLRIAGPMRDESGSPRGWMGVLASESLGAARDFLHGSPYFKADLFERLECFELSIEVGRVD